MKWIFVLLVLGILIVNVSAGFEDTVQNHWDMNSDGFGEGHDLTNLWNVFPENIPQLINIESYSHPYSMIIRTRHGDISTAYIESKYPHTSNYWSWIIRNKEPGTISGIHEWYRLYFYDSEHNLIFSNTTFAPTFISNYNNVLYEVYIDEGTAYLRLDGVDCGAIGSCSDTPTYIKFTWQQPSNGGVHFDDFTTEDGIVGIGAEPCLTGYFVNHSISELTNKELDVSWHARTIPLSDFVNSQYDLKVKRATWGEWYNTTRLKDGGDSVTKPSGIMVYNWSTLFKTDHYGLYWFQLHKTLEGEPEIIGTDFIYYKDVGEPSTINIEDTEYAIGETMNISYYIDSPDFGTNQYKIQIFDATGQLKDERVLTQQATTEQITSTIDWEEGLLYAVLVKDTKPAITEDPPEDIIDLAYDFCTLSNVIYITGTVYDASNSLGHVDGTILDNVSLNWTQAGTIYNTTSDGAGRYEFTDPTTLLEIEWFQDVPIEVHAEKTGYTHDDFTMTIIKAGRYTVDIYLVPTPSASSKIISGLVADDVFHQAIPYAEVNLWNGVSNTTYTNLWGYYETCIIPNGTYRMQAEKETFQTSEVVIVNTDNISLSLDDCDECNYNEAVLDACDAATGWSSDNTLTLNTTDYVEGTGSLQSYGYNATDYYKTFSPAIDANVSEAHGYFYFYSKIDNVTNISSNNVTVKISSNATGATDLFIWNINKSSFNTSWDLYMLKISNATEIGNCNLTNISYFRWESTKSDNVTTKIDGLAFIEYAGWDSCVDLSVDTSDKQEGTGSLKADGLLRTYCNLAVGIPFSPIFNAGTIGKTSDLSRLSYWRKHTNNYTHIESVCLVDSDGDTLCWQTDISGLTWQKQELFLKTAVETGDFNTNAISYLSIYDLPQPITIRYDDIRLIQSGQVQQNFYLSQYFDLTVRVKDADTHYTITDFTAILDTTNVKETTTGTIVFTNITYAIYPLEVSSLGYYTNKQYVFMGQDTEQTVYLTKIENVSTTGVGQSYAPIPVEFRVIDMGGNPKRNVNVSAVGIETTMGAWSWLQDVFGYSSKVELQNTSMNGTTDSMGHLTFIMVETIKYKIDFTKPSEGINETLYFYPKEKQYTVYVTSPHAPSIIDYVDWNLTVKPYNSTHSNLTLTYNDTVTQTSNLRFFVKDENRTEIYNTTFAAQSVISVGYTVEKSSGQSYFWGFNATHNDFGEFKATKAITFKSRLIDLKIKNESYYTWIPIALLVLISTMFSARTSKFGYIAIPFIGGFFYWIGWLAVSSTIIGVVMFFGVMLYMGKRERETGL